MCRPVRGDPGCFVSASRRTTAIVMDTVPVLLPDLCDTILLPALYVKIQADFFCLPRDARDGLPHTVRLWARLSLHASRRTPCIVTDSGDGLPHTVRLWARLSLPASRRTPCIVMDSDDGLPHAVPICEASCVLSQASFSGPVHRHRARGCFLALCTSTGPAPATWAGVGGPCPLGQGRWSDGLHN